MAGSVLLTACANSGGSSSSSSGASTGVSGDTVTLGAAVSLTGALAREGILTREGYDLCTDVVNAKGLQIGGKKVKLAITYQDDKSAPDTAGQLIDQFNDKGNKLILGPYGSATTEAAAAVVERNGQVMVDSSGADDKIFTKGYKRTFAVLSPASKYLSAIVTAVNELATPKPKTVAILSADDGFSKTAADGAKTEAGKVGWNVVATNYFPSRATDVSSSLTQIRGLKPDLVLGSVHLEEGIAIIRQSRELGVTPMAFGETVAPPTPDFASTLGPQAEGVLGSSQWTKEGKGKDEWFGTAADYNASFQQKFGREPEYHAAEATAACFAFVEAMTKANSADPNKVLDAVAALDTDSFFGQIKFNQTGLNIYKPMAVIQIQQGQQVAVWPKTDKTSAMRWPVATS